MASSPFFWNGNTGQTISTPEQAQRQRAIAEALIGRSETPGSNWAEGLADVAAAFTGTTLQNRASEAEELGRTSAAEALAGIGPNAGFSDIAAALSNPWLSQPQSTIAAALLQQNLDRQDPMYALDMAYKQAQIDKMNADASGAGNSETFFGTPIYTTDAEGNIFANQLGNQGSLNQLSLPEGQSLAPVTKEIDTGTEIITFDRNGNELFRTPKQLREAAYETGYGGVEGKTAAENAAETASIASKMPGVRAVVAELNELAEKATYTQSGQFIDNVMRETGQEPTENALSRAKYIAMVDNQVLPLLKDTFGAAFTVQEGESLRATLGNPNASPQEKKAILEAFIEQKERDVAARTGQPTPGTGQPSPGSSGAFQDWQTYFGAQ